MKSFFLKVSTFIYFVMKDLVNELIHGRKKEPVSTPRFITTQHLLTEIESLATSLCMANGFVDIKVSVTDVKEWTHIPAHAAYVPSAHMILLDEKTVVKEIRRMISKEQDYRLFIDALVLHELGHAMTSDLPRIIDEMNYHQRKASTGRKYEHVKFHTQSAINLSIYLERKANELGRTLINPNKHAELLKFYDLYNAQNVRIYQAQGRRQLEDIEIQRLNQLKQIKKTQQ